MELISKDKILQNKTEIKVSCKAQQILLFHSLGLKNRNSLVMPCKQAFLLKTGAAENLFIATLNGQNEGRILTRILKYF